MELFLKVTAGVLLSLVFILVLAKNGKDYGIAIVVVACCVIAAAALSFLEPVLDFTRELRVVSEIDHEMFSVVLKAVGISLLTEITANICADAGNAALGKLLQIFSGIVILWLSLPLFSALLELVKDILVKV